MVAPLTIQIFVAHITGDPSQFFTNEQWESTASKETREWLLKEGLIFEGGRLTERGRVWLKGIQNVPLPRQVWLIDDVGSGP